MPYFRMLTVAVLALSACGGWAQNTGEQWRAVADGHKAKVVLAELVVKQKMSMTGDASEESESKVTATGTVISSEGLTVVSLTAADPTSLFTRMMPPGMDGMAMSSEVTDAKLIIEPGKELPAEVILRDPDLDLAFIRPKTKPETPLPFVDLSKAATPQLLDEIVVIDRAGKVANRELFVTLVRISSVVPKPRLFYMADNSAGGFGTGLGAPAFDAAGNLVGIFVLRAIASADAGFGGGMNQMQDNMAGILVPAAQIAEGASQAPPFE